MFGHTVGEKDNWEDVNNIIKQVSEETLGFFNQEKKEWISLKLVTR
jgi:hypothetical protein